ncbi:hypothetical protein [Pseudonocardia lacus]|uniref:hypothetical protein n=1 Tax=Pseudonocardia lacus TaxID=2835865 RepID=UPI001BDC67C0|nr:hypothetical protein [Pseudonocardia lacus]
MMVKPGMRLRSATCDGQFVVVRPPATAVELTCGGAPVVDLAAGAGEAVPLADRFAGGTQVGKRYGHPGSGLELMCTRAGKGSLAVGDEVLEPLVAKPLPSSD